MNLSGDGSRTGLEPIAKRVQIERKIDLRFPNFEGLVTGVSSNLSTSGMFIRSDNPEPAGTEFVFALRIEEWSPIQGTAKVIWIRPHSESPERPAGMGVQFVDLDAQSRRMIRWLVDKHMQEGGTPFDLESVPAGASMYGGPPAQGDRSGKSTAGSKRPKTRRRSKAGADSRKRLLLVVVALLVLAACAYGIYWKWFQDSPGSGSADWAGSVPASVSEASGDDPSTELETEAVRADVETVTGVTIDEVAGFIRSWTDAWEARDANAVFSHYADDFDTSAWGGRQPWESEIRRQIDGAEHIRFAVSAMEISFPTGDTARAAFFRSFRSNNANQSGRVVLDLRTTGDGWKIYAERPLD